MSTAPPPVPRHPAQSSPEGTVHALDHLIVYGHSNLLYWWPVWLVCFILAAITYFEGNQMAVVPRGTEAVSGATVTHPHWTYPGERDVLVAPPDRRFPLAPDEAAGTPATPSMTVSGSNSLGVIFATTLILVALVSTVTLRGLVSLIVIILLILAVVALALFDLWDNILAFFGGLDIRMNAAGYLFIGVPLFLLWAFVFFVYDRHNYMVFDEGQIRYVLEIGDSVIVRSSEGAMVEKKRSDVFRHWLLGLGTGDIIVRTNDGTTMELYNVVNANRKMVVINDMLRHRPVVKTAPQQL
jgi:hypothetical protein